MQRNFLFTLSSEPFEWAIIYIYMCVCVCVCVCVYNYTFQFTYLIFQPYIYIYIYIYIYKEKIHFFGDIMNLFQVYDDSHQMLNEKNYLGEKNTQITFFV